MALQQVALLLSVALGALIQEAHCHGFILQPMSRGYVSFKTDPIPDKDYDPMGANGGGPSHVYDSGRLQWPHGRYDLCGEPFDKPNKVLNFPRMTTGVYNVGATISVHFVITANHMGNFELRVCPLDATAADREQRCTLLQRADPIGKGHPHWTLPAGELPDSHGRPLMPLFRDGSYDLYEYSGNDDFRGTPTYILNYTLPAGLACDKCILHWYWLTGNSCNPPCETTDPLWPSCDRNQMGFCGQPGTRLPEEFWGCSDVSIKRGAQAFLLPPSVLRRRNETATPDNPMAGSVVEEVLTNGPTLDAAAAVVPGAAGAAVPGGPSGEAAGSGAVVPPAAAAVVAPGPPLHRRRRVRL